jgi:hypothetical protein
LGSNEGKILKIISWICIKKKGGYTMKNAMEHWLVKFKILTISNGTLYYTYLLFIVTLVCDFQLLFIVSHRHWFHNFEYHHIFHTFVYSWWKKEDGIAIGA